MIDTTVRISEVFNEDCMVGMARYPDKWFDLAVVDPPYGIGADNLNMGVSMDNKKISNGWTKKPVSYKKGDWDKIPPTQSYFDELYRISKYQIIWGGNHFDLGPSKGCIVWDKLIGFDFSLSQCELAYTNVIGTVKKFTYQWAGFVQGPNGNQRETRIHPTQKPVALYDWIYKNYLPNGGKVIDTHLGSGSNRIAANKAGNIDFVGFELDKDYYEAQEKRWMAFISQTRLF